MEVNECLRVGEGINSLSPSNLAPAPRQVDFGANLSPLGSKLIILTPSIPQGAVAIQISFIFRSKLTEIDFDETIPSNFVRIGLTSTKKIQKIKELNKSEKIPSLMHIIPKLTEIPAERRYTL